MSNKSARQCSVEMAKWKNALVMYDPAVPVVMTINSDYDDCRPSENVLGVNDRVVGNASTGIVSSQINQCNASYVVRDVLIGMMAYGKFMGRALESAGILK